MALALCGALLAPAAAWAAAPTATPAARAPLGVNLPPVNDWMYTPVYADLMYQARRFGSPQAPWDERATLRADGWPAGDFGVLLSTGLAGYAGNAGTYRVLFKGRAQVAVVASRAQVLHTTYRAALDETQADVQVAPEATQLALAFTGTGAGISALRVLRPGYTGPHPPLFTREFLAHIQGYSALRFMDWLRTNETTVVRWSERSQPQTYHYAAPTGVPWEHIIALANQTGQDIWINIPIAADDDYIRQLAQLLHAQLHARTAIYLENSNEVWNGSFPQHRTNAALALEAARQPGATLAYDGERDPQLLALRFVAEKLVRIARIFRSVYGDAAMLTRVRPVLAGQVVQPYLLERMLEYVQSVHGAPAQILYGLAGAPYFNMGEQQTQAGLQPQDVLDSLQRSVARLARDNALEKNLALARWYGLPFLAYEGGVDTFGPGSLAAKAAANRDPRMEALCRGYLDQWYGAGGALFMWYQAGAGDWNTPFGTWQLTDAFARQDSPKIRCLNGVSAAGPATGTHVRHAVPGAFDALEYAGNFAPYSESSRNALRYLHPGSHVDYLLYAVAAGRYLLKLVASAATDGNAVALYVDGRLLADALALPNTGWDGHGPTAAVAVELAQGVHTLRIETRRTPVPLGGFALQQVIIEGRP